MWSKVKRYLRSMIKENNDKMVRFGTTTSYYSGKSAAYRDVLEYMKKLEKKYHEKHTN